MSRVSRTRNALAAVAAAAFLAVGATAAPAQAATGTISWLKPNGESAGFPDAPDGLCWPVEPHSTNLRNNTTGYVAAFISTTAGSCTGEYLLVRPSQTWRGEFTSFRVGG